MVRVNVSPALNVHNRYGSQKRPHCNALIACFVDYSHTLYEQLWLKPAIPIEPDTIIDLSQPNNKRDTKKRELKPWSILRSKADNFNHNKL